MAGQCTESKIRARCTGTGERQVCTTILVYTRCNSSAVEVTLQDVHSTLQTVCLLNSDAFSGTSNGDVQIADLQMRFGRAFLSSEWQVPGVVTGLSGRGELASVTDGAALHPYSGKDTTEYRLHTEWLISREKRNKTTREGLLEQMAHCSTPTTTEPHTGGRFWTALESCARFFPAASDLVRERKQAAQRK